MSSPQDPRVLFAAERTLLAWNRTSISIMAFGFVIERFGLFLQLTGREESKIFHRDISFIVGESFILLASLVALYSIVQHKKILRSINVEDVPAGYNLSVGMIANAVIGFLGLSLGAYLFWGF